MTSSLGLGIATAHADEAKGKKLYDEGRGAATASNMALAVQLFQDSLAQDPKSFRAAFDLGLAFEAKGDHDDALRSLQRAVDLRPDFAEAHVQMATIYLTHRRDSDRSIQQVRLALLTEKPYVERRFPLVDTRARALTDLALAYAQKGQYGVAHEIGVSFLHDPAVDHDADAKIAPLLARTEASLRPALQRKFGAELEAIRRVLQSNKPDIALQQYKAFERAHPSSQLAALDLWDLNEGMGQAWASSLPPRGASDAVDPRREAIVAHLTTARDAAEHLDHHHLVESTLHLAGALAQMDRVDAALQQIEALLWLESITLHDPAAAGKPRWHEQIRTDPSLANVRASPALNPLLARYGF